MPLLPTIGRTVGTGVKALRMLVRGSVRGSAWATRRVGAARARGAANEIGMVRLFDLHAVSCAGDTLIAIGLAGTIFFSVPTDEARSKVALYLLVTMVPFALLAPVVGPLLDHFRHGRRYALAATMLGRAFLAYVIADNLLGWGLYPATFGVLALSRAYGVARSAAVPRLLPDGIGLSQVGARASVYGTFAGAVVAPIGLAAFWFGPQWPLRVAAVIFLVGMVIALRLPPRADSDPPEAVPRPFRAMLRLRRGNDRPLSGKLVIATLVGSASFRCLYGFLLLYFAFAVKAGALSTTVFGHDIGNQGAVAVVGGALAIGTFLATAVGTRLRIRRPTTLQSSGLTVTAVVAVLATIFFTLPMVALLSLVAATFSGISKLAVDASIQERVPERLRASAFAHSETVLMIAWVTGGAVGIIPLNGRLGVALAATFALAAAVRGTIVAGRLRQERLHGRPDQPADDPDPRSDPDAGPPDGIIPTSPAPAGAGRPRPGPPTEGSAPVWSDPDVHEDPQDPRRDPGRTATGSSEGRKPTGSPGSLTADSGRADSGHQPRADNRTTRSGSGSGQTTGGGNAGTPGNRSGSVTPGEGRDGRTTPGGVPHPATDEATPRRRFSFRRRSTTGTPPPGRTGPTTAGPGSEAPPCHRTRPDDRPGADNRTGSTGQAEGSARPQDDQAPPGFHIYRPSSASNGDGSTHDESAP